MVGWGLVRLAWQGSVRQGTVCHGLAGLVGYGLVGSCTVCLGLAGEAVLGLLGPVMARLGAEWFGWRVMFRLGAVLCGTVMYGLVWLAWFVAFGHGAVWHGLAWQAIKGGIIYGLQIKRWCTVENRCPNSR